MRKYFEYLNENHVWNYPDSFEVTITQDTQNGEEPNETNMSITPSISLIPLPKIKMVFTDNKKSIVDLTELTLIMSANNTKYIIIEINLDVIKNHPEIMQIILELKNKLVQDSHKNTGDNPIKKLYRLLIERANEDL